MSAAAATARYNPAKWSSGAFVDREISVPNLPTQFDSLVHRLGLETRPDLWTDSRPLCKFAKKFRKTRYVPEFFLAQLGLDAECEL